MSSMYLMKTIGFLLERHNDSIQVTLDLRMIEESVTRLLTNASNNICKTLLLIQKISNDFIGFKMIRKTFNITEGNPRNLSAPTIYNLSS